jgi:L-glutamine:2-deoxy-scyllo-inosose/3-amino-2,3-dideoxy-scyllo-inosose aminotransferase
LDFQGKIAMNNLNEKLALLGGTPAVNQPRPTWPVTDENDLARMADVVRSGKWSWMGPQEQAFCQEFADFVGAKHCMCMSNGTVTIQCGLQAVGVQPGDEVIVPALTWVATAQAAMDIGADVVLVDIDPETYCIDPQAIEAAITPRTKAIIPVHLYGCMCDMDAIMDIARRHKLKVVEDTAHQHGSRWRGQAAGTIGDAGSFSFQQSKVLTSGEGGALVCNDAEVQRIAFCLKQVGWEPDLKTPGNHYAHNYRITEMQAALLRGGLERLPEQNRLREENAMLLATGLAEQGGPIRAARRDPRVSEQARYCMTLHYDKTRAQGLHREQYRAALEAEGVAFGIPYPPVYRSHLLNLYASTSPVPFRDPRKVQDYATLSLPVTERIFNDEGLVLYHAFLLGNRDYIRQILTAIAKVQANLPALKAHFSTEG